MIIKFGSDKTEYDTWAREKNIFISRPFFKIVTECGVGFYVLNSYKFNIVPKFSFHKSKSYLEYGVRWLKINLELQYNKAFAK